MADDPDVSDGDAPRLAEQTCVNCGSTQLTQDTDGLWHCGYCRSTFRSADPAMIVVSTPNVQQSDERVVDTGDLLTFEQQERVSAHLLGIQQRDDVVVVVETVNTITENVERYARRRAQDLGVGDDAKDNGLYILLVRDPRRIQVQAGNGVSTHLGPEDIDRIVRERAVPSLKAGDVPAGLIAAADGLVDEWRSNRAAGIVRTASVAEADAGADEPVFADRPPRRFASAPPERRTASVGTVLLIIAIIGFGLWMLFQGGFTGSGGSGTGGDPGSGYNPGDSGGGGYDGGYDGGGGGGGGGGGYDGGDFDTGGGGGSDY